MAKKKAKEVKKPKVMFLTDAPNQTTGYGNVMRNTIAGLTKLGWDCYCVGVQIGGMPMKARAIADDPDTEYTLLPRAQHHEAADCIHMHLIKHQPDVFVTLRDIGLQAFWEKGVKVAKEHGWKGKWGMYVPLDTDIICPEWPGILSKADFVISMSAWGKTIFKEAIGLDTVLIPHGVDTKKFYPMETKDIPARKKGSPMSEMFLVGAVGRNQTRKKWDVLFKAWKIFSEGKNDVMLVLHTDKNPPVQHDGFVLDLVLTRFGIKDKVVLTKPNLDVWARSWFSDDNMREVYNSFDVFAFPTGGEGFGIPLLEAQACGVPVITTAFTTGFELVEGHGKLTPLLVDKYGDRLAQVGMNGVEFVYADHRILAKQLQEYYDDRKELKKDSEGALKHAQNYAWPVVCKVWDEALGARIDE